MIHRTVHLCDAYTRKPLSRTLAAQTATSGLFSKGSIYGGSNGTGRACLAWGRTPDFFAKHLRT